MGYLLICRLAYIADNSEWSNLSMIGADLPCRTYIVYHHGLFAQGVRSMLEDRNAVEIVGMESDVTKALKAVQSLQPEVIIVEECTGKHQPMRLGAFMHSAGSGRVVTLSLDHGYATVYQRSQMPATAPDLLVKAIQGDHTKQTPRPDQPESSLNGGEGRPRPKPRVRGGRKQ